MVLQEAVGSVYTDPSEADLYVAIPGRDLVRVAEETAVVRSASATLLDYPRRGSGNWCRAQAPTHRYRPKTKV